MIAQQGGKQQRRSRVESESIAAALEKRAGFKPVAVTGIGKGSLITVKPSDFSRLDVDPSYQRGQTNMVNQIIRAIQSGGAVLDPVTLCQRPNSDKFWIIDGYQRVCAFQQTKLPFQAMLHPSDSGEAEHDFFIAMNSRRAVSANVIVKAWTGPSANALRKANESFEHPLYDRVNFTQASSDSRMSASTLVSGMKAVAGMDRTGGRIEVNLSRLDIVMAKRLNVARVEHYLRLVGKVCERGVLPAMVVRGLGLIAAEHWDKDVDMPSVKVIERLRSKNWAANVVLVEKYMPVLLDTIRKVWKP